MATNFNRNKKKFNLAVKEPFYGKQTSISFSETIYLKPINFSVNKQKSTFTRK